MRRRMYLGMCGSIAASFAGCTSDESPEPVTNTATSSGSGGSSSPSGTTTEAVDNNKGGGEQSTPTNRLAEAVVGEIVRDDPLAMVVREISTTEQIGEFQKAESGSTYVVVELAIKNVSTDEYISFSGLLQTRLKDDEGYSYGQTFASTGRNLEGGQIAPGEVSRGDVVYEVPQDASGLVMQFDFRAFSLIDFSRVEIDLSKSAETIANLDQNLQIDIYQPGDSVEFENTVVTLNSTETATQLGSFAESEDGHEFFIVDITTTNNTSEELNISILLQMLLKDGQGFNYSTSIMGISAIDRGYEQGSPLAPGETRRGKIVYEVPKGKTPLYWAFEFSTWIEGTKTFWKVR